VEYFNGGLGGAMYSGRGLGDAGGVSFLRVVSRATRRDVGAALKGSKASVAALKGVEVGR
jgi:hypothetical protein